MVSTLEEAAAVDVILAEEEVLGVADEELEDEEVVLTVDDEVAAGLNVTVVVHEKAVLPAPKSAVAVRVSVVTVAAGAAKATAAKAERATMVLLLNMVADLLRLIWLILSVVGIRFEKLFGLLCK